MKLRRKSILILICFVLVSFAWHKFYVSIYQIEFVPEKKALHITSRLFADDVNLALQKTYHKNTHIGEENESPADVELMKKYLLERLILTLNTKVVPLQYVSNEKESNVVICYFKVTGVSKVKSLEVKNTALFEVDNSQQNIIQLNFFQKKQNLLLTSDNVKGLLKI